MGRARGERHKTHHPTGRKRASIGGGSRKGEKSTIERKRKANCPRSIKEGGKKGNSFNGSTVASSRRGTMAFRTARQNGEKRTPLKRAERKVRLKINWEYYIVTRKKGKRTKMSRERPHLPKWGKKDLSRVCLFHFPLESRERREDEHMRQEGAV